MTTSNAAARERDGDGRAALMGAFWITLSMALLAGLAALGRYAAKAGLDPLQVVFFRNLFCVVWMLPLLAWRGWSLVATGQLRLYGLRVALSFLSMMAWFHALALAPLGEVTAIGFLSPLFGTLFAVLMLGERIRWRRIAALCVGFAGAMIILRPGVATIGAGQLLALASAMAVGVIGPLVKQLTERDDPDKIVFLTNLMLTPLSLVPAVAVWRWPGSELWPYLGLMGLTAVLGHMTMVRGYAAIEASLAMTFKFSKLPFAAAIAYLAFGEQVDMWTWVGAIVIVAASVIVTRREIMLRNRPTAAGRPPETV